MGLRGGRRRSLQAALLCLALALPQPGWAGVYRVRQGDWLAHILRDHVRRPIWGATGSLAQTLQLNPSLHDPNCIVPGQLIVLPEAAALLPGGGRQGGPAGSISPGQWPSERASRQRHTGTPKPRARRQTPTAAEAMKADEARPEAGLAAAVGAAPATPSRCAPDLGPAAPRQAIAQASLCSPCTAGAGGHPSGAQPGPALQIYAGPTYSFSRLASQDLVTRQAASLASQSGIGANIKGVATWPSGLSLFGATALQGLVFAPPPDGQVSLQDGSALVWRAVAGVGIVPMRRLRAELLLGARNGLFLAAETTNRLALRVATLGMVQLGAGVTPWQTGDWQLHLDLAGNLYQGPARVARGLGWEARLGLLRRIGPRVALAAALAYGQRRQGTSATAQAEQTLDLQLGLSWGLRARPDGSARMP